ncbi:hypothetical protein HYC85_020202 [Camellia sinensis]|uniref:Uncharacterized protein n=1 Tax=Camellia sinensis TaxID=4442 RepID=A0A7J7GPC8_CAMSI|nr:hypothetical protein HYC85_020202 [Camellia sinensis]
MDPGLLRHLRLKLLCCQDLRLLHHLRLKLMHQWDLRLLHHLRLKRMHHLLKVKQVAQIITYVSSS